jgi:very-short-patch-repair endonuclease
MVGERTDSVAGISLSLVERMEQNDLRLIELAARQHHLVTRADVATRGLTSQQWCDRLDQGLWVAASEGVFRHVATPLTWDLRVRAAALSLGRDAALYGPTAARWWGLDGFVDDHVEFVVPRIRRSLDPSVRLHTTKQWNAGDLMSHNGVRTTTAIRTIIDLAASRHSPAEIENAIDSAVRLRLASIPRLTKRMGELTNGRRGIQLLREILLDSGGESYLERRFLRLIRGARLPGPTCQVVHATNGRVMRVDFEFRATNVIVEVSGRLGHTSDRDRQKDARRRNELQQLGKTVLEFTTVDVLTSPVYVLTTLHTSGVVTC